MRERDSTPDSECRADSDEARRELFGLVKSLARIAANAPHNLGIKFDVSDPQAAGDLIVATLDAIIRQTGKLRRSRTENRASAPLKPPKMR